MPNNKHKIDERNHVELPLLDQLRVLDWEVLDLGLEQKPKDRFRENFTEAGMLSVLREQLQVINPWLESDQVESVVKSPTASFPGTNLLNNNQYVLQLLHEGVSASENRVMSEQSGRFTTSISKTFQRTATSQSASLNSASVAPIITSFRTWSCFLMACQ
jgi:type I site-specific restriction-modification system R (restriction) subunit